MGTADDDVLGGELLRDVRGDDWQVLLAGGQRVAMSSAGNLCWLLADQLGSTAITANTTGAWVGEVSRGQTDRT